MIRKTFIPVVLLAIFALGLWAAPADAARRLSESELRALPGYVDFGDVWRYSDGDEEVEVELTQPLLGVVAPFLRGEDPELADLILDLHLVRVNAFSFSRSDEEAVLGLMRNAADDLRGDNWDNIVKVRSDDENVNVFVHIEGDGSDPEETFLSGLAVLVVEDGEAAFVNVVGRFRMEDIARIGQHFDMPHSSQWRNMDQDYRRSRDRDRDEDSDDQEGLR